MHSLLPATLLLLPSLINAAAVPTSTTTSTAPASTPAAPETSWTSNSDGTYTQTFHSITTILSYQNCADIRATAGNVCAAFMVYDGVTGKSYQGDCITSFNRAVDPCLISISKPFDLTFQFTGKITPQSSASVVPLLPPPLPTTKASVPTTTAAAVSAMRTPKTIKIPQRDSFGLYWIATGDHAEF
ncbi:hypothetical protein HDU97_009461 [Phlyctochytrium planicorne]|nr:hypothetical protein HDU97_009461 [Phlyctochytrium planicorne]